MIFFRNKKGQAPISEYALIFAVILGMLLSIGVYFKRAVQARIKDTNAHMVETVRAQGGLDMVGPVKAQYEPYYLESSSDVNRSSDTQQNYLSSFGTTDGIFQKSINESTYVNTNSSTLPAAEAK